MTKPPANIRSCENGATAVEMAITLLAVIVLILGMCEFAVGYWMLHTTLLAVEEIGRYAMVNNATITATDAESRVCNILTGSTSACSNPAVGQSCSPAAGQYCVNATSANGTMTLTASYGFNFIELTGGSLTLTSQVTVPLD